MIRRARKIDLEDDKKVAVKRRGRKSKVQKQAELAQLDENEATKNWEYAVLVCDTGKRVWIGVTTSVKDAFGNQLLVGSHAHYAIDAEPQNPDNNAVMVYNPWGLQGLSNPPGALLGNYLSPVAYNLPQLMGIAGLDFAVLRGP